MMSYCRFSDGDVYAYETDGGVQFYVADGKRELDRLCNTFDEAYQYAKILRDTHGLDVPSRAIEALKADAIEEAARICGPNGAVAELESENAKLRDINSWLYGYVTDIDSHDRHKAENAKLRELARRNWFIALSERDALRIYGVDPVEENYFTVLDKEMSESRATMQELGIEVE